LSLTEVPIRFIKLGGSLLDWGPLKSRFSGWLAGQPPARNVVVVGGGRLADQIRYYDELHQLDSAATHRAAVLSMSATAQLAASLLGNLPVVTECEHLRIKNESQTCVVLDPFLMLTQDAPSNSGVALPLGWHVTGDSISAYLAQRVGAQELVLLKSSLPACDGTWQDVARSGHVDEYFPNIAKNLTRVRMVNLRDVDARQWQPQNH